MESNTSTFLVNGLSGYDLIAVHSQFQSHRSTLSTKVMRGGTQVLVGSYSIRYLLSSRSILRRKLTVSSRKSFLTDRKIPALETSCYKMPQHVVCLMALTQSLLCVLTSQCLLWQKKAIDLLQVSVMLPQHQKKLTIRSSGLLPLMLFLEYLYLLLHKLAVLISSGLTNISVCVRKTHSTLPRSSTRSMAMSITTSLPAYLRTIQA